MEEFLRTMYEWLIKSGAQILGVLVVAFILIRVTKVFVKKSKKRIGDAEVVGIERAKRTETLASIIETTARVIVIVAAVLMALKALGLDIGPLLAGAGDGSTVQRGAMDADLSLDDIGADESTAMREALPEAGLEDDDDFDFLGDTDENATKLDLAKAYIDMGDNEGARDILNEVISEGSPEQQQEARDLLAQVG